MLKQEMKVRKLKFYVLFTFIAVIQLSECRNARREESDVGANEELSNLVVTDGENEELSNLVVTDGEKNDAKKLNSNNPGRCWISMKSKPFFRKMDRLHENYKNYLEAYKKEVDMEHLDKKMLDAMLQTRAVAERALQNFGGNPNVIPAGLNLGDHSILRMPGSLLFFYRLKLRNNTRFVVNYINNDVEHLTITLRLSLNDLHLVGQYERALTSQEDPSKLFYRPNKGGVEFLLKDVKYKVEGRYRLLDDRLHIEHILSEIPPMEILMRYSDDPEGESTPLEHNSIKDYLQRMKHDLNEWLKDYFNDFLMLYGFDQSKKNPKVQEYHNERTILMNKFSDGALKILNRRLRKLGAATLIMPDFTLTAANGMEVKLYDGSVLGVDTMYRRSIATGKEVDKVSYVDTDIGFGTLKVQYRYNTYVRTGLPPLSGIFVLNTDDISAHMALQLVKIWPESADLLISFLRFGRPETLTVEGPANRIIANFKHLLEHHIISIMSTTLIHHIRSLSNLVKCEPNLPGKDKPRSKDSTEEETDEEEEPPLTDGGNVPPLTDGENVPPLTGEETVPSLTGEDTVPSLTGEDTAPSLTGEETVPSLTGEDTVPSLTGEDTAPSLTGEETVPSLTGEDTVPSLTGEETVPSLTGEDTVPSLTGEDTVPSLTGEDTVPSLTGEDTVPSLTDDENEPPLTGEETVPSLTDDENEPPLTDEETVPSLTDDKNEPPLTDEDGTNAQNYRVIRQESIELELPPEQGSAKGQKMKLNYNENFVLKKLNNDGRRQSVQLQDQDSNN